MRKRHIFILISTLLVLLLLFCVSYNQTYAASKKKAVYYSSLIGKSKNPYGPEFPCVKYVKIKGNKLIIKSSFKKGKTFQKIIEGDYKLLKYKKRKFKIKKGCKYYRNGGDDGMVRVSKRTFLEMVHLYNGLGIRIYTDKKGRVYKLVVSS